MNNTNQPVLKGVDLHKTYRLGKKHIPVLRGLSVELPVRESMAIMGASGSGKSTLLHVIGGLDTPDKGVVEMLGNNLYRGSQNRRGHFRAEKIGFVFQAYHLLPELDVLQNVYLPAMTRRVSGVNRAEKERAKYLLDQVGLSERADHRPNELSGGEQQRVAIARALMNEPELLLADEPTGNLDSVTGERVLDDLFKLVDECHLSMIMVTHDERVAARCSCIRHLRDGCLLD